MQGVLGEGGFPSPTHFLLFFGFLGRRPRDPKGPELSSPKGGREERGGEGFPRKGPEGAPRGDGRQGGNEGSPPKGLEGAPWEEGGEEG